MPSKNGSKQKEITKRRLAVAQLFNEGHKNQFVIAELLKDRYNIEASQPTVSVDLKALDKQWKTESKTEIDMVKGRLIAKYEQLYNEAYQAWLLSLQEAVTEESGKTVKGPYTKTKRVGQSGNPGLLAQAQSALKAIRELLGTDAPLKYAWQDETLELFKQGKITLEDLVNELGSDLAKEFVESAGLQFAGIREAETESSI